MAPPERYCVPWRELPDEVVNKIQARLPLASLFRSRSVCKAWSGRARWAWLLRERAQARGAADAPESVLYLADRNASGPCAYDPGSDRWYRLDPWLPPEGAAGSGSGCGAEEDEHRWCLQTAVAVPASASASGSSMHMMEVAQPGSRGMSMAVGNPVRGCWAHLPPFPWWPSSSSSSLRMRMRMRHVRGLFLDRADGGFKAVAVADPEQGRGPGELVMPTFVFDSRTWRWSLGTCAVPASASRAEVATTLCSSSSSGPGAFVGRVLYCLTARCNLLAYDLDRAAWSWMEVGKPADSSAALLAARVVAVDDQHLVCAGVVQEPARWRLHVWRMDWAARTWLRLHTMPAAMFDAFLGRASGRRVAMQYLSLSVASIGHAVYIMSRDVAGGLGVACDLQNVHHSSSWRWLPRCPFYDPAPSCSDRWLQHLQIPPSNVNPGRPAQSR